MLQEICQYGAETPKTRAIPAFYDQPAVSGEPNGGLR
jgi:hypothetical protein